MAVPLAVCFAYYSLRYFVACLVLSVYTGTAFYFLFHANLPALQIWIPPSIAFIFTSGVGLLADWVSLDEISPAQPTGVENTKNVNENAA